MEFLKRVPIWIRLSFFAGGFLLSAFSSRLPDSLQTAGAFTGFAVMIFAIVSLGIHRIIGWYRGMASSNKSSAILSANTVRPLDSDDASVVRDVWLQDAVCYAVHERWLGADEKTFSTDVQMNRASAIAQEMRQLAYDGKFNIWGKARRYYT